MRDMKIPSYLIFAFLCTVSLSDKASLDLMPSASEDSSLSAVWLQTPPDLKSMPASIDPMTVGNAVRLRLNQFMGIGALLLTIMAERVCSDAPSLLPIAFDISIGLLVLESLLVVGGMMVALLDNNPSDDFDEDDLKAIALIRRKKQMSVLAFVLTHVKVLGVHVLETRESLNKQVGFCDKDSGNANFILPFLVLVPSIIIMILPAMNHFKFGF